MTRITRSAPARSNRARTSGVRHRPALERFPVQSIGAFTPWRGAKEVSGVALVVAQNVPTSSSMAVPHGPAGVGEARHRMRAELRGRGVPDAVVDDAVLVLSELLSNACRYARPLGRTERNEGDRGAVRAAWRVDGAARLTIEVTDGGGPTRPVPATPSVTARGGRGLNIISALAQSWGVRDDSAAGEVTVWAVLRARPRHDDFATRVTSSGYEGYNTGYDLMEVYDELG
ncbi:ATP-binding protein [Streptomyces clavuligerus]|uniref:Regulatory protein n=1 Tax=Streptomyces clavuligerus TaxID=1901 RepID=E2PVI7_STRCL|nr:ATP-binding protein [Streptomyces clavuligerus]EFG07901.1 Regulatory protein [Streptomyces clavuligerus]MBY6303899.1 ATP-binding protein [Streptomyces clavuligerus]QCS06701.1 ATP-binding protein [Streptomyces clavuligerus]QPJ93948.1 ATP-binding protein [Streptomyces clavuligerus]